MPILERIYSIAYGRVWSNGLWKKLPKGGKSGGNVENV